MTDADPADPSLRDLLMEILAAAGMWCGDCDNDDEPCSECRDVRAGFADVILSDPRIAVVALPEVVPQSFEAGPLHAKLPHAESKWPRVQRCDYGDDRIALASIHNPFRTDIEAADTAAAILAILRHTNNRGDQS